MIRYITIDKQSQQSTIRNNKVNVVTIMSIILQNAYNHNREQSKTVKE